MFRMYRFRLTCAIKPLALAYTLHIPSHRTQLALTSQVMPYHYDPSYPTTPSRSRPSTKITLASPMVVRQSHMMTPTTS